jgi:hypothetical protein
MMRRPPCPLTCTPSDPRTNRDVQRSGSPDLADYLHELGRKNIQAPSVPEQMVAGAPTKGHAASFPNGLVAGRCSCSRRGR